MSIWIPCKPNTASCKRPTQSLPDSLPLPRRNCSRTPEQSEALKKPEPKHSVTEKMKFLQEQSSNQQEQKTPQQKKQNMEL